MFAAQIGDKRLIRLAMSVLVACVGMSVLLSVADGAVRRFGLASEGMHLALLTWIADFRYFFEQGVYAATILWVGARFLAQRTILTVGFDTADSTALSVQGPDENNVVWIGRRYRARLEAEAVVAAM